MPASSADRDRIEQLAEEFAERYRRGERPALSEYTNRYPELADEIRQLFPAVVVMEQLKPAPGEATGAYRNDATLSEDQKLERLGDYRILREVGRGGMGIVYEAEQESLGRHVALKLFPFHKLSNPSYLERFRREARAAGRLHHTNIVPVFGVGESDGLHYYAMQFIHGEGLDKVVRDLQQLRDQPAGLSSNHLLPAAPLTATVVQGLLTGQFAPAEKVDEGALPPPPAADPDLSPKVALQAKGESRSTGGGTSESSGNRSDLISQSEWQYCRSVARVGLQVAEALAYAHRQGILHRDIKPSNLLLDLQGTVWVTDFGLAKAEGTEELTETGDFVGTLRFMAPERFTGASLAQSDVYGLGLTLYELLTLRPAFADDNRARLIERITHEEPPRPRKLDRRVPLDLETIVLKAIAKDAHHRYESAEALAEDLRRFLADRPIRARRVSWRERSWRWCRRNPVVASLIGATALLLLVIAIGGVAFSVRLAAALDRAEQDRDDARSAQGEAREQAFQSLMSEAKAQRHSRRIGQRFGTLEAIRKATALARELRKPPATFAELRNLAIAALALPDLRPAPEWVSEPAEEGWNGTTPLIDPQGRRYVVFGKHSTLSLRSLGANGNDAGEIARLPEFGSGTLAEWSKDGRFLAVWHHECQRLQVWRMEGRTPALAIEEKANCAAFGMSEDGRELLAASGDGLLRIYDLTQAKVVRSFALKDKVWDHIRHHPHLPQAAFALQHGGVLILDVRTGKEVRRLSMLSQPTGIAWHPEGEILAAAGEDVFIYLWNLPRNSRMKMDHRGGGVCLAFSRDGGLLASWGWAGRVKLWDPYTGREVLSAAGETGGFGPDQRLAMPFRDSWKDHRGPLTQVEPGREYRTMVVGLGLAKDYHQCKLHPDGRLLAVATKQGVGLFDLTTGSERAFLPGEYLNLIFEPGGALLINGSRGLERWPVQADPEASHRLRIGPPERVPIPAGLAHGWLAGAQGADGTVLAMATGDGATVWRSDRPREAIRLAPHPDCRTVALSPDGKLVATGAHNGFGLKVWSAAGGKLVRELIKTTSWTIPIFSPDGRWLYNHNGKRWRVGDWTEGSRQVSDQGILAIAPDMRLAAWDNHKGFVTLVHPETGKELARLEGPYQDGLAHLVFNAEGSVLIGTTNDSACVRVWDLRKIREGLKPLGLDWDAPPYGPPRPEKINPARAPQLEVKLVGAE